MVGGFVVECVVGFVVGVVTVVVEVGADVVGVDPAEQTIISLKMRLFMKGKSPVK